MNSAIFLSPAKIIGAGLATFGLAGAGIGIVKRFSSLVKKKKTNTDLSDDLCICCTKNYVHMYTVQETLTAISHVQKENHGFTFEHDLTFNITLTCQYCSHCCDKSCSV